MGKQISLARPLRAGQDARGFSHNRQVQANRKKIPRASAPVSQSNAGKQGKRLETETNEFRPEMGEKIKRYFMRCPELGIHDWELTTGPESIFAAVRMKLARADHDEAFPVAIGHKAVTMEVRYANNNRIMSFKCEGRFSPKYQCERVS